MSETSRANPARFLQGSIFRHVVVMTLTSALGLMTLFLVDLADLYFLSSLKNNSITAAIGFGGTIDFANLSLAIGAGIAAVALVARNVGAGNVERAKRLASNALYMSLAISAVYTAVVAMFIAPILTALGATGETARQATIFIWTLSPGFICLAGALSCSFSLRGLGDARRAMFITLTSALTTLILDPLFIFKFGWGIQGAAAANAVAYATSFAIGLHGLARVHHFLAPFSWKAFREDLPEFWGIALPAIVSQLATPFAAGYLNYAFAKYGDEVVVAGTVVNRVVPVAFGVIFSLSGAVGPIIGQNFGAGNFPRVKRALRDGLAFAVVYSVVTSGILYLLRHSLISTFHISGRAAALVDYFATYIAISWVFLGGLFVAAAAFNNLGKPTYSTWTNWGRATLGTIPFAMLGAAYAGAEGILVATAVGGAVFGLGSMILAYRLVNKLNGETLPGGQPSAAGSRQ